ncbi:conserved hypothetical protein [Microcystis aeruginosa PCC 9432]|jgi:hypothetical protein|uniref:Uncharacterized protein n=3 Tax=Microcystis aeruginosa TaxID=1126 RepID=I4HYN4_MICAE|nr:hypothetical protein [Microcystis aeruginosa]TRT98339.1 MAG: hypothetical protein EWV62_08785 [Microcystis aeruginosa Ma_OC_LR_19540900_S633]MDB9414618.1 hypothetical protein [Microcystis aeruginosa CS-567/02]CCH92604.1 conserved hypothetical protein [Microcystis aeruginosa PCC 9432]CCI27158.1 conserved hypothetical protein [Microcystis aeruginosa PCC 9809]CCI28068.1 conserved hypothetical protein [Microcystis aeruginosa PCC 9808]
MPLTSEEKQKVLDALDELDRDDLDKILAGLKAFSKWLKRVLYEIYLQIEDGLQSLWNSIRSFFS